jgi:argininosuccinate lyase
MAKLWQKGYELDALIEKFTVGNDPILDKDLIYYDCIGSIAHAHMLMKIGILKQSEFDALKKTLLEIIECSNQGAFAISQEDEDVHTSVENYLTSKLGELGQKIHTARSRNDQVLLDLRLYMKDQLLATAQECIKLCTILLESAQRYQHVPLPGRTHFQKAMPSSVGLLFGAYAESLLDSLSVLHNAYALVNQSPLGSAASYGVILPLDRQHVADLLGFDRVQNNVLYVNNSRGKIESIVLHALTQIMVDLSKVSTDLIIFSAPEFNYFTIPQELCSGSSLMPQKRNPCGLELVRAKSATVISYLQQVLTIIRGLPSGYNRDFQETKEPLMRGFSTVRDSIGVCSHTIDQIQINEEACLKPFTAELFATDYVLKLVQQGESFRAAYRKVAQSIDTVPLEDPRENIASKMHQGAPGNLGLSMVQESCQSYLTWADDELLKFHQCIDKLLMLGESNDD